LGPKAAPAIPAIRRLLDGPDPRMRTVAADLLGKVGAESPEAEALLADRINSKEPRTRLEALHALEKLGPAARHRVPELLAKLRDPDMQTHQAAARALASVLEKDPTPVLPDLLAMLQDRNPVTRASGAHALSRFGERAAPALGPLQAQLNDRDPLACTYAAIALGEIGKAASPALPKLKELSKARDFRVSGAARDAVSHIRGVPTLSQQLGAYR
jgi:HEAT repeat protein